MTRRISSWTRSHLVPTTTIQAGPGLSKDVVCGLQVRTSDAPARTTYEGHDYYFCSDNCHDKCEAEPTKYTTGPPAVGMNETSAAGATVTTPGCGMNIDPHTAAGHATHDGVEYSFCSDDCREATVTEPTRYLTSSDKTIDARVRLGLARVGV